MKITSLYGEQRQARKHYGLDLVGLDDITVLSIDPGTVKAVNRYGTSSYGNHVFIAHPNGTSSLYAHLSKVYVKEGQAVGSGERLGVMGNTGRSTGAHLHLEVRTVQQFTSRQNTMDPAVYLGIQAGKGATVESQAVAASFGSVENQINDLIGDTPQKQLTGESRLGDILYGRRYRVIVEGAAGNALDVSDLRCTFDIKKTYAMEPNQSSVTIYNLSPKTENALIAEGQRIIVEAGYEGEQYGLIFDGNVLQPIRSKESATDYALTLLGLDGDRYLAYGFVNVALVAGQTARTVLETCAQKSTVPADMGQISANLGSKPLPRGKVLFGMARDYLRQISRGNSAAFSIQDGKIVIQDPAWLADEIFSLSPTSGLIGYPEQTEYGMSCRMLLNPRLKIGSPVHIDNSLIRGRRYQSGQGIRQLDSDGIYKIITLRHFGDTHGADWYTEIETVAQAGIVPAMMTDPQVNPF